jgi:hypothetical protein
MRLVLVEIAGFDLHRDVIDFEVPGYVVVQTRQHLIMPRTFGQDRVEARRIHA